MTSPLAGLLWEIWRRSRSYIFGIVGCVLAAAAFRPLLPLTGTSTELTTTIFQTIAGILMAISFMLLMGVLNYTEFNSNRDWNGFPYRLFVLPIRTWKLVALPLVVGLISGPGLYVTWLKLVWIHGEIHRPEWLGLILAVFLVFYQTALWVLAGFRIARLISLALGGVSAVGIGCLPFFAADYESAWFSPARLSPILLAAAVLMIFVAMESVARQRCGGGRRRDWRKALVGRLSDAFPRRQRDFASAAAAQFWFEWRRSGWLLPVATVFVLCAVIAPISWFFREQRGMTVQILFWSVVLPPILSTAIGKGFAKPDFWSGNLAWPTFLAVRPIANGLMLKAKWVVALIAVACSWVAVGVFLIVWLRCWAATKPIEEGLYIFQFLYPHSWYLIIALVVVTLLLLSWKWMTGGLWLGLSGNRFCYDAGIVLQVISTIAGLVGLAVLSGWIDRHLQADPELFKAGAARMATYALAAMVIVKVWSYVFLCYRRHIQFSKVWLALWTGGTCLMVALALLARPVFDTYRLGPVYVLGALLVFPLIRPSLAAVAAGTNRHR